eukprot:CAMPEP_0174321492 /NCGR_PEP_ID=MMETSP0810-20121108/10344_1 /TAXON_ID=73025 ORGANISM="Eutreptiella gymnastica-like, Strain CCMP1594" /NCGR_SAMPLE_ID=MMETSP0810 /ASSEMBLY_ACC=CAM_ASM_000659 /LENGTH=211 /DNA_ID=CAMNT_0015432939 /DNA_START=692 /DNA_END=1324 /DNA_ORIENTATION=+
MAACSRRYARVVWGLGQGPYQCRGDAGGRKGEGDQRRSGTPQQTCQRLSGKADAIGRNPVPLCSALDARPPAELSVCQQRGLTEWHTARGPRLLPTETRWPRPPLVGHLLCTAAPLQREGHPADAHGLFHRQPGLASPPQFGCAEVERPAKPWALNMYEGAWAEVPCDPPDVGTWGWRCSGPMNWTLAPGNGRTHGCDTPNPQEAQGPRAT